MSQPPEVAAKKTDPEKLILAVKKHPCIWNSSCPDYRNKTVKLNSWEEVATEVLVEWTEFTRTQRHIALRFLVRRWNNIRDYFNKSIKANYLDKLQGNRTVRKKKYAFADALDFLRPELEKNLNVFVHELGTAEVVKCETEEQDEEEMEALEEEEEEPYITLIDTLAQSHEESEPAPKRSRDSFGSTSKLTRRYSIHEDSLRKEDDPDLMFLKSLLPDMKKLEDGEKFAFKYAIMNAYMEIIKKRSAS